MDSNRIAIADKFIREKMQTDPSFAKIVEKYKHSPQILYELLDEVINEILEESDPFRCKPVDAKTFIEDPYFGGARSINDEAVCSTMYEKLRYDFIATHETDFPYREIVLRGSIGYGKSFFMSFGLTRNLYYLSCFKNPQKYFGLSPSSKIAIMIISITEKQAKKNMFFNVKEMVKKIPYFRENFYFDEKRATESLIFPNNIEVFSGTSTQSSTIGLNVFSAALDEANFFKVIEASKRSKEGDGEYDEALVLYNALLKRQESRFLKKGRKPGILYLGSSAVYPNDFTEQRIAISKQATQPTTYVMNYSQWSVCREKYSDEEFKVEIGGLNRQNRILDGYETDVTGQVISVPMDFFDSFKKDMDGSIRDIAGIALYSVQPFIGQREYIGKMFDSSLPEIFSAKTVTLSEAREKDRTERILKTKPDFPNKPRYVAMDIGLKKDKFGFAMGYIEDIAIVKKEFFDDDSQEVKTVTERLPKVVVEMVLEIEKDQDFGEVELSRVRYLIMKLISFGYRIRYASADGFQSTDMQQILKRKGIQFDYISMDKDPEQYETFRSALYEERIKCVYHEKLEKEMNELERNYVSKKIDHPVRGSKDLIDAVGQLVYNCHVNTHFEDDSLLPVSMSEVSEEKDKSIEDFKEEFNLGVFNNLRKVIGIPNPADME